jgi:serine/threonine/tyrosine-interacting protein
MSDNDEEERQVLSWLLRGPFSASLNRDWKYPHRREAQAILPFLFLGPSAAARDTEYLQRNGITLLLAIRNTASAHARLLSGGNIANKLGISSDHVDVEGNQQLIAAFPKAVKIVNDHLIDVHRLRQSGATQLSGKVLVFCESGNERSAAVVAAYIMATFSMDMIHTIQFIQSQRFSVAFDDGLKLLLQSYEQLLQARSSVAWARESTPLLSHTPLTATKRGRDDYVDEDGVDMDMDEDAARFGNRSTFAPFADA